MYRANHTPKSWSSFRALPIALLAVIITAFATSVSVAQQGHVRLEHDDDREYGSLRRGGFIEVDPTLDVEVWTDNESGEYYEGDKIQIYFRTNRDAYVAVYNIDTDGRVNLIYPFGPNDDPYIDGGRIYRIPGPDADYDLLVDGPTGVENIQIIASRRPFPIPNWYSGSGLVADRDRYDFMDYINGAYFGCRSGCPRALDNISYVVKEWDNYYYRPVYYNPWPVWGSYGGLYIDYYWGSSIYVDGYYYGIAPLYLPRIGYGHHVISVYDSYGYAWENTVNIHNSTAIYLDNSIIRTTAGVNSRYRSVRNSGYRNPARNGYAGVNITSKYRPKTIARKTTTTRTVTTRNGVSSRSKIDKPGGSRGFNYKKNDRASSKTKTTRSTAGATVRAKSKKSSKSATSGKRLTAYKNGPDGGSRARVGKSRSSGKSSINTGNRESSKRSGSSKATRSGKRSGTSGRSSGKSSYERRGSKSSSNGRSKATRSKTSRKSSGNSSAKRSRSGGSKSSARGGRSSSSRSGVSARSGRSGRSSGASRGGRSSGRSSGASRGGGRSGGASRGGGRSSGGHSGGRSGGHRK